MRRPPLLLVLVLALLTTISACGGAAPEPPRVTFSVGAQSVTARPTQYCNIEFTACRNDAAAPVALPVPPGTAVRITVAPEIAATPWLIVFTMVAADGTRTDGRTGLFSPPSTQRSDYELALPAATDRLLTAQVQQLGAPPQANGQGDGIDFPVRGSWVLTTTG
ncbi:MAG: DUF2771 domain-containing protein [Pseudonocardia sp.]|nr:DUF2771 domain-containing protein [Pseudonocardia sp.]